MKRNTYYRIIRILFISVFVLSFYNATFSQVERITKGSIIEIRVYGHDELSKTVMVQPNGMVEYPLLSNIPVDGFSVDELREILRAQLTKYLPERPIVSVRLSQTMNVGVTVLGQVVVPGEYIVAKRATVQGAITHAGGTTPRAQLENVKLIRRTDGETETIDVNLYRFYVEGDPSLLPVLEDGDIVVVPGAPGSNDVKVIGEVRTPGAYQIFAGASILDAIYMAGGPTENASLNNIRLVSPLDKNTREIKINLKNLLQLEKSKNIPEVKPGDIIYIPSKSGFFRGFMSVIRNVTSLLVPIAMILWYSGVFTRG